MSDQDDFQYDIDDAVADEIAEPIEDAVADEPWAAPEAPAVVDDAVDEVAAFVVPDEPPMPPVGSTGPDLAPPTESTPFDGPAPVEPIDLSDQPGTPTPTPDLGPADAISTPAGDTQPPLPDGAEELAEQAVGNDLTGDDRPVGLAPETVDSTGDPTLDPDTGMHVNADRTEWHDPTTDRYYTIDPESGHLMWTDPETGLAEYRDQHTGDDVTEYVRGTTDDTGTETGTDEPEGVLARSATRNGDVESSELISEVELPVNPEDRELMLKVVVEGSALVYDLTPEEQERLGESIRAAVGDNLITGREIFDALVHAGADGADGQTVDSLLARAGDVVTITDLGDGTAAYRVVADGDDVHLVPLEGGDTHIASRADFDDAWRSSGARVVETKTTETITLDDPAEDRDGDGEEGRGRSFGRNVLVGGAVLLPIAGGATYLATRKRS